MLKWQAGKTQHLNRKDVEKVLECNHCKELELLKAENSQLKRDQEFLFLVMDSDRQ